MAKHMTWTLQAQILLVAHDSSPPSDDEWQAWLREFERCAPSAQAMLVYSTGGGPTSSQRKELLAVIARLDRVPRVVIVTSSNLMRGLATAVGWFLAAERRPTMFAVDEMAKALSDAVVAWWPPSENGPPENGPPEGGPPEGGR